jgi:hypothetical protein
LEAWLNKYIINQIDPNYELRFVGLDSVMMKDKIALERHKMNYLTINEIRAEHDLPPIPGHDVVKDLALVLAQNAQSPTEIEEMQQNEADKQKAVEKNIEYEDLNIEKAMPEIDKDFDENKAMFTPPEGAVVAARRALNAKAEHGSGCGTSVGWARANQLANREAISYSTIKRMFSFFSRHSGNEKVADENKDTPWKDCGYLMHLAWGGNSGFVWCKKVIAYVEDKLEELEQNDE